MADKVSAQFRCRALPATQRRRRRSYPGCEPKIVQEAICLKSSQVLLISFCCLLQGSFKQSDLRQIKRRDVKAASYCSRPVVSARGVHRLSG